jgi:hypothetical protein
VEAGDILAGAGSASGICQEPARCQKRTGAEDKFSAGTGRYKTDA